MSAVGFSQAGPALRNGGRAARVLGLMLALCVICLPLFSQTNQGTIQGAVFDQSGGAIAGAAVTVIDVARGVTRTLTADSAGEYVAELEPWNLYRPCRGQGLPDDGTQRHSGEVGQNVRVDWCAARRANPNNYRHREVPRSIPPTPPWVERSATGDQRLPLNGRNFERLLELRPGRNSRGSQDRHTRPTAGAEGTTSAARGHPRNLRGQGSNS